MLIKTWDVQEVKRLNMCMYLDVYLNLKYKNIHTYYVNVQGILLSIL